MVTGFKRWELEHHIIGGLWECKAGVVNLQTRDGTPVNHVFGLSGWVKPNKTILKATADCKHYVLEESVVNETA
jgi:hypothetical protein